MHLLEPTAKAIDLFERIYAGKQAKAANPKLASWVGEEGNDVHFYPSALFWGGISALNAGRKDLARKRLIAVAKIGGFHVMPYLAALNLNMGTGPVGKLMGDETPWACLASAAENFAAGDSPAAADWLKQVLKDNPHVVNAVDPQWRTNAAIQVHSNLDALATVMEFFHFTAPFWKGNEQAWKWLLECLENEDLRKAYAAFHRAGGSRAVEAGNSRAKGAAKTIDRIIDGVTIPKYALVERSGPSR